MGWKLERSRRSKTAPVRWYLRDRSHTGRSAALGEVSEEEAKAYLHGVLHLDAGEHAGRWLRWYDRTPGAALAALLSDNPTAEVVEHARDFGGFTLRRYHREVYAPARATTKPRSWKSEQRHWPRILREIGHVRVRAVDPWVVADFIDGARVEHGKRRGQPMAGNSKRLLRAALQALLKHAHRRRHIESVPDLATFRIEGSTRVLGRLRPLTVEEAKALLLAADVQPAALFAVQLGNGLRPSEAIGLRWDDIVWDGTPAMRVRGTKTEQSASVIPLTSITLQYVRALWVERGQPEAGPMFITKRGRPYADSAGFRRVLRSTAERAEISRKVTPYTLRATFATLAWYLGIPEEVTYRMLRHTDSRMVREVYSRPSPAQLAEKLAGFNF